MARKNTASQKKAEFKYAPPLDDVKDVHLVGDFNDWEVGRTRMKPLKSGVWKASLSLLRMRTSSLRRFVHPRTSISISRL